MRYALLVAAFLLAQSAHSEILRCTATEGMVTDTPLRLDIVLPDRYDLALVTVDRDGRTHSVIQSAPPVAEGIIEVTWFRGKPQRMKLIITRIPVNGNSLHAFYIETDLMTVIKVDTWQEGKPFILYDIFSETRGLYRGKCA